MKELFKSKFFRWTILSIIMVEILSFFAWALPGFGNIAYFVILAFVLILSMDDLRYGAAIVLAELIIGSHGYLFSFGPSDISVSLRLGIFLVLMTVALLRIVQDKRVNFYYSQLFWPWLGLVVIVAFAFIRGLLIGNGFSNTFFDMNAFMFLGLALPLWQAFISAEDMRILLRISLAAVIMSLVKVYFLVYIFSHKFWWMLEETYRWVRDTRIGEVTQITDTFFRVFFQSQIFTIIAFFVLLLIFSAMLRANKFKDLIKNPLAISTFLLTSALFSSILISFSRSYWVGVLAATICLPFVLWIAHKNPLRKIFSNVIVGALVTVVSLVIVTAVVLFPYPSIDGDFSPGSLLSKRALTFRGEAGVSSRWQLLPPLWQAVQDNLIYGSGFGKTVTYITQDPRILAQSPTGEYTTFAFEWGYLDLWLKLGLIGLLAYAIFVFLIIKLSIQLIRIHRQAPVEYQETTIAIGLLLGGITVLATHTFSPYLNHPLGIGYLLFWALFVERLLDSHRKGISMAELGE